MNYYRRLVRDQYGILYIKVGNSVYLLIFLNNGLQERDKQDCYAIDNIIERKTIKYYRILQSLLFH